MSGKTLVVLQSKVDELFKTSPTPSPIPSSDGLKVHEGFSSSYSFLQLIGLVFLLILILAAAYYTSKFVAKATMGQMKNSNFHVIDSYRISPNKAMQIIKVGNKYILIAIGKETINYITELDEAEVFIKEPNSKENINFKEILDKLKNKMNKSE